MKLKSVSMEMAELARAYQRQGLKVYNMGSGQPDLPVKKEILDFAYQKVLSGETKYADSMGIYPLREKLSLYLSQKFKMNVSPDELLITPGAKQGLFYLLKELLEEGKLLLFSPIWLGYKSIADLLNKETIFIGSDLEKGFIPDVKEVEERIKLDKKIRVLIINNPVNPTGALFEKNYLEKIVSLCKEHKITLIADEVYEDIVFNDKFVPLKKLDREGEVILLGSFSKTYSLTGLRIGYIWAKRELIEQLKGIQQTTATCVSTYSQWAAYKALDFAEKLKEKVKSLYYRRWKKVTELLHKSNLFEVFSSQGTFYLFLKPKNLSIDEKFCLKLLQEKKVAVVPGNAYGPGGEGFMRITLTLPDEELEEAIKRIIDFVKETKE